MAFNPFDANVATGTDKATLVKIGGQWTHLLGDSIETNINGGFVHSFATRSGIVATVTGEGIVVPTIGNQSWFEFGGRVGYRISKGWIADLFVNGTAGPQPVGNTLHGGVGLADHVLSAMRRHSPAAHPVRDASLPRYCLGMSVLRRSHHGEERDIRRASRSHQASAPDHATASPS